MKYYKLDGDVYKTNDEDWFHWDWDNNCWNEFFYYELPNDEYSYWYHGKVQITEQEAFLEIL